MTQIYTYSLTVKDAESSFDRDFCELPVPKYTQSVILTLADGTQVHAIGSDYIHIAVKLPEPK